MQEIKDRKLSINTIEILVFTIIWLAIFSIPYLVQQSSNTIFWEKIFSEWVRMAALLILFLINIVFLVPRLLFAKKYLLRQSYFATGIVDRIAWDIYMSK